MLTVGTRARAAALGLLGLAALATPALGQAVSSPVTVVPLVRSAAFSFRLDQVAPSTYVPGDLGPLYAPNPVATLEWRVPGADAWRTAQPFVRVQVDRFSITPKQADPRMATMLFGLREGAEYEYRVAFKGEGFPTQPVIGRFTTLTSTPPVGPKKVVVTVSETTTTSALRGAIKAAYDGGAHQVEIQSAHGPGVRTQVRAALASVYHGGQFGWSGTASAWKRLAVAEGHDIVFNGALAAYDVVNAGKWKPYTDAVRGITAAHGVYVSTSSIARPATVRYERPGEDSGILAFNINAGQKTDRGILTGLDGTMVERAKANGAAWAWLPDKEGAATGRVYLRLHHGRDPNTVRVKIPALSSILDLGECRYVVIEGLHIAYAGGWIGGIGLIGVDDIVIKDCRFVGTGMLAGARTSANSRKNRVVMKGNVLENRGQGPDEDPTLPVPVWSWSKASTQERIGVPIRGVGVSIIDNKISGVFNGVSNYAGMHPSTTSDNTRNNVYADATEVDGNDFYGIGDDSIEPEQWCVNQAYTRNTFRACYKGISCAPVIGGPLFILRNTWLGQGEFAGVADKQAFLKMGNDNPGDPAYKVVAHNTMVNINANANGVPLVGIANSGSTYNHYYYNNYVASDGYPVDMGYGVMGYPHIFDGNRYRSRRFNASIPGYDRGFSLARIPITQGEPMPGSDHRTAKTFDDWQRGRAVNSAPNWPGFDGSIPKTPRVARTQGTSRAPAETVAWLHDPNGTFSEGGPELVDPFRGDFRPHSNSPLQRAGVPLANISFDCGPGWAQFEENGRPTVGAIAIGSGGARENEPPQVTVDGAVTTGVGEAVAVTITSRDWDGEVVSLTATVTDPTGKTVESTLQALGEGVSSVVFTPVLVGLYTVKATARDNGGLTAESTATVTVSDAPQEPPGGELAITMSASRTDPRPGEPIVYTIRVVNPTARTMTDAVVRQNLPPAMQVNTASLTVDGRPAGGTFMQGLLRVPLGELKPGAERMVTVTAFVK